MDRTTGLPRPLDLPSPARRVLVISYAFPPVGGAGVQRTVKFTKYLPQFGWLPTVLTVANPSVPAVDEDLARDIRSTTTVLRARTWEPAYQTKAVLTASAAGGKRVWRRWLRTLATKALQPDPQILWNRAAERYAARVLRQGDHEAIFVSGPPFSSFLLGASLSRRFGLPLALDFRDEWTLSQTYLENQASGKVVTWRQRRMMERVIRVADAVVATTEASAAELRQLCDRLNPAAAVVTITNGFDPDDLTGLPTRSAASSRFRLVYTGTLWNLTDVGPLVRAVERLDADDRQLCERLELVFVGRRTAQQDELLARLERTAATVVREDYLPHRRSLQRAASADALCLLLANEPGAARVVPGKLFEYLALRLPILAIAPTGETSRLLPNSADIARFQPHCEAGIASWLAQRIEAAAVASESLGLAGRRATGRVMTDKGTAADLEPYSRRTLTRQLAELLDQVCSVPDAHLGGRVHRRHSA